MQAIKSSVQIVRSAQNEMRLKPTEHLLYTSHTPAFGPLADPSHESLLGQVGRDADHYRSPGLSWFVVALFAMGVGMRGTIGHCADLEVTAHAVREVADVLR